MRLISMGVLLLGLMTSTAAVAESVIQPTCVCNDDCYYSGEYCNDYGYGGYCDWSSPGISCTDGGIPDAGTDAGTDADTDTDTDAEPVSPDVPFTPHDVQLTWDSQPPDDVAELSDGDVAPMSPNRGCACNNGGRDPTSLPVGLWVLLTLTWLHFRRRSRFGSA